MGLPIDPLTLDPDGIAFHQLVTFSQEPISLGDALQRSPLFSVEIRKRSARGEWIRYSTEHEASFFPFGRISVHPHGVLLEAFTEERMEDLRRRVNDLGVWKITADQRRVFRADDAIAHPAGLLQPIHELEGRFLARREVAETFLRLAWPFFPREDLDRRAPHAVIGTGRGRAALDEILPKLPSEFRSRFPSLPEFEIDELRAILLPAEAPKVEEVPEEKPHPADDRRRS
jgi:hypothetical protein